MCLCPQNSALFPGTQEKALIRRTYGQNPRPPGSAPSHWVPAPRAECVLSAGDTKISSTLAFPERVPGSVEIARFNCDRSSIPTEAGTRCAITEPSHCIGRARKDEQASSGRAEMKGASGLRSASVWQRQEGAWCWGGVPHAQDGDPGAGTFRLRSGVIHLWELVQGSGDQTYVLGSTHPSHSFPKTFLCPSLS